MSFRASVLAAVTVIAALSSSACVGNNSTSTTGNTGGTGATSAGGSTTTAGGGGTGGDTGGTGTTTSTTTQTGECTTNTDCEGHPNGPICDPKKFVCVSCLYSPDPASDCGIGQYCNTFTGQCEAGCTGDVDCTQGVNLLCDTDTHACVGCLDDQSCPAGTICIGAICLPGCNDNKACVAGKSCCGESCFDLATDEQNCGACNSPCPQLPNTVTACLNGQCTTGECSPGYKDCNGQVEDGCETNTLVDGDCACDPGADDLPAGCDENLNGDNCICKAQPNNPLCICYTNPASPNCAKDNEKQTCYLGAPGTLGVGICKAGTRMCKDSGVGWGPCLGQTLPQPEVCGNGLDDNCDGTVDNPADADGDGWTTCEGDCNDGNKNVNPGAFEVTYALVDDDNNPNTPPVIVAGGNGVDDDCDPSTPDNVDVTCSTDEKLTGLLADDLRKAIDLCQTTTPNPPKAQKKWGVLTSEFKLGSGATPSGVQLQNIQNKQAAVLKQFGWKAPTPPAINFCQSPQEPNNAPKKGATMAGISTGIMRYVGQPGFIANPGGPTTDLASGNACPPAYIAANNNKLPSSSGCNGMCPTGTTCNDSVSLRLTIRVPSNALGFSYDFKFISSEFPEWVCQNFNDFFLALLTSGAQGLPADKNVSFDGLGNPLSVNNGFFDVCQPSGCFTCPKGTGELDCTGMENGKGGSTTWLTTDAPVVPGETVTLELMVFDVQDNFFDSHALIDNFRWTAANVVLGTHE
ncbi:MAG: choice-of-anchor L domain-containing protein [Polyangiaceae bacterium]